MNTKAIGIAFVAGCACVFCIASVRTAGLAAVPFLFLASVPIYAAALSFGTIASIAASGFSILIAAILLSAEAAVFLGLAYTIPASLIGHQANLAQQNQDGGLEWYPLNRLFLNLCLAVGIGVISLGFLNPFNEETLLPVAREALEEVFRQNPSPTPISQAEVEQIAKSVLGLLPFMFASMWLIVHVINAHLAAMICRATGSLPRPKDNLPKQITLPVSAVIMMSFSLLACLLFSGTLLVFAKIFAGIFLTAFALIGLAGIHQFARTSDGGKIILVACYILIFLFFLPLFLLSIGGVIRSLNPNQNNPQNAGPNST